MCFVIAFSASFGFAQMTPPPLCDPEANPEWLLLSLARPGSVFDTQIEHDYWMPHRHATSILPAEGEPPAAPTGDDPDGEAENEYRQALAEWSCMYGPQRVVDGDPATAWSEGAPGLGEGEIIVVHLGDAEAAEIWTGFGRSERLHKRNGRPRAVRLHVVQALSGMANQFDLTVGHFVVLARATVELDDVNAYQPLPLPAYDVVSARQERIDLLAPFFDGEVPQWALNPMAPEESIYLAIEILSVYPGSVYEDTLISEVRVE
jgi:hypothetical protein